MITKFFQFTFEDQVDAFTLRSMGQEIKLLSQHRNTIGAIFFEILLHNIGGSETFENRQANFYAQLMEPHRAADDDRISVMVQRSNLLRSVCINYKGHNYSYNYFYLV